MDKQSQSNNKIALREQQSSLVKVDPKAELITAYIEKFAIIAQRPVTPALYAIYIESLSDLELRKVEKGLKRYLQEGDRFPWPGTLREYIEDEV